MRRAGMQAGAVDDSSLGPLLPAFVMQCLQGAERHPEAASGLSYHRLYVVMTSFYLLQGLVAQALMAVAAAARTTKLSAVASGAVRSIWSLQRPDASQVRTRSRPMYVRVPGAVVASDGIGRCIEKVGGVGSAMLWSP